MEDTIIKILKEKVDPILANHYGGAMLTAIEDGVAYIRFTGACAQCPSAQDTLEQVVRDAVMSECSEIKDVRLDTTVSEDLLDMARKILNHEI